MSRIFITGSSDGLGLISARNLIAQGHRVTLHARSAARARDALAAAPGAAGVLVGDLGSLSEVRALAAAANETGRFDAVVHNAALGFREPRRDAGGIALVFAVNSLAPYVLTCLMLRPRRLVYMSSGLHGGGDGSLEDVGWTQRSWSGTQAYSDSKLYNVMLALAVARRWGGEVESNACDPRWVATKMGGAGAPGKAEDGAVTMTYLAGTDETVGSGKYWRDLRPASYHRAARDTSKQDQFLQICEQLSGVPFPE